MKKYTAVRKMTDTPFLNFYEIDALTTKGQPFHYYFVSRDGETDIKLNSGAERASGMAVYGVTPDGERLVMIRQYRYPLGRFLYELPAGLIEPGETDEQAAVRELKEETGLDLAVYQGGSPACRRAFCIAQGFSDEMDSMIYGTVSGEPDGTGLEDSEDIKVCMVDRSGAKRILESEPLSIRAGYMLMQFLRSDPAAPFAFLEI